MIAIPSPPVNLAFSAASIIEDVLNFCTFIVPPTEVDFAESEGTSFPAIPTASVTFLESTVSSSPAVRTAPLPIDILLLLFRSTHDADPAVTVCPSFEPSPELYV